MNWNIFNWITILFPQHIPYMLFIPSAKVSSYAFQIALCIKCWSHRSFLRISDSLFVLLKDCDDDVVSYSYSFNFLESEHTSSIKTWPPTYRMCDVERKRCNVTRWYNIKYVPDEVQILPIRMITESFLNASNETKMNKISVEWGEV